MASLRGEKISHNFSPLIISKVKLVLFCMLQSVSILYSVKNLFIYLQIFCIASPELLKTSIFIDF